MTTIVDNQKHYIYLVWADTYNLTGIVQQT